MNSAFELKKGAPSAVGGIGGRVQLVKHTISTGGVLIVDSQRACRLTPIQFELVSTLALQAQRDALKHSSVRGFVSSYELLGCLQWDTAHPHPGHLKQLVRRLRRRLERLGLRLEAHYGLGYRLVLDAAPPGSPGDAMSQVP